MKQIDNFRQVLGLDTDAPKVSVEQNDSSSRPQVKKGKEQDSQERLKPVKRQSGNDYAKSIRISSTVHRKIRLLGIWLDQNGVMQSPSVSDIVDDMLECYVETKYPKAKSMIGKK